ncbi:hypothetical protein [Marinobacter nauticus]|uniref:hypothetical protein n=1 Tax=Marinobacter nauticus TaxID=2743 RepID=UPI0040439578
MKMRLVALGLANLGLLIYFGHAEIGFPFLAIPFFIFALIVIWWPPQEKTKGRKKLKTMDGGSGIDVPPFSWFSKTKSGSDKPENDTFDGGFN